MGRKRTDANHQAIVATLRDLGVPVVDTSHVGKGFPDCVALIYDRIFLIEIKDGSKAPSKRALTAAQQDFHSIWPVTILTSKGQAIEWVHQSRTALTRASRRLRTFTL